MKQLLAGFVDVWRVLVITYVKAEGEPFINWFDIGVLLGILSMLGLIFGVCVGLAKIFS